MNKMISYLFWFCMPLLFFTSLFSYHETVFYAPFGNELIEYDIFAILVFCVIYFLILGFVFRKIKIENSYLTLFGLFTILSAFLFFQTMIDETYIYRAIEDGVASPDIFATRTKIFYAVASLWLVAQIVFWLKILIHFFNQDEQKIELLDDVKF